MHPSRARFGDDIVAEFFPPKDHTSQKVVLFCDGMPGPPGKKTELLLFFAKRGYWAINPRYRGAWESGGEFLHDEPTKDILDVLDALPKGFTSIWDGEQYRVDPKEVVVVGGSFGGPAAILSLQDSRVTKAIAIASIVDWRIEGEDEPLEWLGRVVKEGFGMGYRYSEENWEKLGSGFFYNPVSQQANIDGSRLFLIHAKDDRVAPYSPVSAFATAVGARLYTYARGGHLSSSIIMKPLLWWRLRRFLAL